MRRGSLLAPAATLVLLALVASPVAEAWGTDGSDASRASRALGEGHAPPLLAGLIHDAGRPVSGVAAADVTGDGSLELVVTAGDRIRLLAKDGRLLDDVVPTPGADLGPPTVATPAGAPRILVMDATGILHVLDARLATLDSALVGDPGPPRAVLVLATPGGERILATVTGADGLPSMRALDSTLTTLWTAQAAPYAPAAGELRRGRLDVFTGAAVLNTAGTLRFSASTHASAGHLLADLDGDGVMEVILARGQRIDALRGDTGSQLWSLPLQASIASPPAAGNFSGEGVGIVVATEDCRLHAIRPTGSLLWSRPVPDGRCDARPAILEASNATWILHGGILRRAANGEIAQTLDSSQAGLFADLAGTGRLGIVTWEGSRIRTYGVAGGTPPIADAGGDRIAHRGEPLRFDASRSLDPDGSIVAYRWDFGDGIVNERVATWAFEHLGAHPVTLTVTDDRGLQTTARITVHIHNHAPRATLEADATDTLPGLTIRLHLQATDADGDRDDLTWRWDLDGDGTWDTPWGTDALRETRFDEAGSHEPRVEVTDGHDVVEARIRIDVREVEDFDVQPRVEREEEPARETPQPAVFMILATAVAARAAWLRRRG